MDIRDAIFLIKNGNKLWARPIKWRGSGQALYLYNGCRPAIVPSAKGGLPWYASVEDILGDWEVVNPDTVLDEAHPSVW
jgi:hypothetical protein